MTADGFVRTAAHPDVPWWRLADTCEKCLESKSAGAATVPHSARQDGGAIRALYRCPQCLYSWNVGWDAAWVGVQVPYGRSLVDLLDDLVRRLRHGLGGAA